MEKSEAALQSEAFINIWNSRPSLRMRIFAITNNSHNKIKGAINKSMGTVRGVSDMCFVCKYFCVWIEWKKPGENQSADQIEFEKTVIALGHVYVIARSETEFIDIINKYE